MILQCSVCFRGLKASESFLFCFIEGTKSLRLGSRFLSAITFISLSISFYNPRSIPHSHSHQHSHTCPAYDPGFCDFTVLCNVLDIFEGFTSLRVFYRRDPKPSPCRSSFSVWNTTFASHFHDPLSIPHFSQLLIPIDIIILTLV